VGLNSEQCRAWGLNPSLPLIVGLHINSDFQGLPSSAHGSLFKVDSVYQSDLPLDAMRLEISARPEAAVKFSLGWLFQRRLDTFVKVRRYVRQQMSQYCTKKNNTCRVVAFTPTTIQMLAVIISHTAIR
jgi:hypothetical protein